MSQNQEERPVVTTVYISSGRKNAIYTLRIHRTGGGFHVDHYVRNLCRDPSLAEAKARDWFERVFGDRKHCVFDGFADFDLGEWATPEPWEREMIEKIENGVMPFGQHKDKTISKMTDSYVLWWAEQEITDETNRPSAALIDRMKGIASERDLYKKREARIAEYAEKKALSSYIGTVGERQHFDVTVEKIVTFESRYGFRCIQRLRCGNDLVVYWGEAMLGEEGDTVAFSAGIKDHSEYQDEKQTIVHRPTKIQITPAR